MADVEIDAHFGEDLAGAAARGRPVEHDGDEAGFMRDSAEEDVFGDGQFGDDAEFLIDGGDAVAEGVGGGIEFDGLAVDGDLAVGGLNGSGEDFYEGAFAGAIFSKECGDFAGVEAQGDVVQGECAGVLFADSECLEGCLQLKFSAGSVFGG